MDTLLKAQNGACACCATPIGTVRVQISVSDPLRYELTEATDGPGVREIPRELYERFKRAEAELAQASAELDTLS